MIRRRAYAINQCPLYKLSSRKRLASEVFGLDLARLQRLALNGDENFRVFDVVHGEKTRQVEVPKPILERIHRRLFALLERIEKPNYLHSGIKGRSYISNANAHLGNGAIVKVDIKKFYPSVDGARIYRFFSQVLQCSPDAAALLTRLTTFDRHLPTGSCVSQLLAFFAARPMFDELEELATLHGVTFTVYVDDMTFSGENANPEFLWQVKQVIHSHGFSYHKDRFYHFNESKLVTGVLIEGSTSRVLPSRELDMWNQLHSLSNGDLESRKKALNRLVGSVMAAGQIEPRFRKRLKRLRLMQLTTERQLVEMTNQRLGSHTPTTN